jgi:hypothetical protein
MANWWRFTLEQGKFEHWFQIHPSRMDKMQLWMDKMVKKYPQLKIHISHEMDFHVNYCMEWDSRWNLIKFTQNYYKDENFDYNFEYSGSDIFYYKKFPDKEVNIRKLKLQEINVRQK